MKKIAVVLARILVTAEGHEAQAITDSTSGRTHMQRCRPIRAPKAVKSQSPFSLEKNLEETTPTVMAKPTNQVIATIVC